MTSVMNKNNIGRTAEIRNWWYIYFYFSHMLKPFFTIISVLLFLGAVAQKKSDTLVYYLKNSGAVVSLKDSADFFLLIMPPDVNVDKKLFVINEFYASGALRLAGNSLKNTLSEIKFQGPQIIFFPNGHKMKVTNFNDGVPVGTERSYYPNGKLYTIKTYDERGLALLTQCNDSTGNVIADNGKGKWVLFDDNFKNI